MSDLSRSSFFDLSICLSIYLSSCGRCGKSDSVTFGHIMGGCPWVLNVENKTTPSEDTRGGTIMCSEFRAMQ